MGLGTETNLRPGRGTVEAALALFPELRTLLALNAGMLSGGEQQILGLARAVAARLPPLLVDELSLGLVPKIVQRMLRALREAAEHGTGILLVEQHARQARAVADRGHLMSRGRCALSDSATEVLARIDEIERAYIHGPTETATSDTSTNRSSERQTKGA